jgi:hypothetical protein
MKTGWPPFSAGGIHQCIARQHFGGVIAGTIQKPAYRHRQA